MECAKWSKIFNEELRISLNFYYTFEWDIILRSEIVKMGPIWPFPIKIHFITWIKFNNLKNTKTRVNPIRMRFCIFKEVYDAKTKNETD